MSDLVFRSKIVSGVIYELMNWKGSFSLKICSKTMTVVRFRFLPSVISLLSLPLPLCSFSIVFLVSLRKKCSKERYGRPVTLIAIWGGEKTAAWKGKREGKEWKRWSQKRERERESDGHRYGVRYTWKKITGKRGEKLSLSISLTLAFCSTLLPSSSCVPFPLKMFCHSMKFSAFFPRSQ